MLSLCQDAPLLPGAPIALLGAGPASSGLSSVSKGDDDHWTYLYYGFSQG